MKKKFKHIYDKNIVNRIYLLMLILLFSHAAFAQPTSNPDTSNWFLSPGIIGTIVLIFIVLAVVVVIVSMRLSAYLDMMNHKAKSKKKLTFSEELIDMDEAEIDNILERRKAALKYRLTGKELGSQETANDTKGIVSKVTHEPENPLFDEKKKTRLNMETPAPLKKIVIWYLGASIFWLVFGTLIGQYVGMKFIWPEMDTVPWLSFGRLRPVHTNTVFWGWASMAMIGLGYFVIARTSNTVIYKYKWAWRSWYLINLSVLIGNIFLLAGINNGGGEYREYIWPVAVLFMVGLIYTFRNFYKTVANRRISDIYVSNWYLFGGLLWTITLAIIGYLPNYQDGLGETVIQGYYMHQGVGMWFMTFTLGLVYYYLPSSLNKPIYSYSLGVLAF